MKIFLLDVSPDDHKKPRFEILGIAYLKGNADRKHDVHICYNAILNFSIKELINIIAYFNPDILGLSLIEINAPRGIKLIKRLRKEGYRGHITLGHHFPTFNHKELLTDFKEIDSIVRGEGEKTFNELVERIEQSESLEGVKGVSFRRGDEIVVNPPRPLIEDLDSLNWPARDYSKQVYLESGSITLITSRGCYGRCSFCSISSFYGLSPGKKWRCRSPENVVDEIEYLNKKFNFTRFTFIDDQFIGPGENGKSHSVGIAENILKRNLKVGFAIACRANDIEKNLFKLLKRAGLATVFIGVESGFNEGLKRFNKGTTVEKNIEAMKTLDQLDIPYKIGFIFFDNETSFNEVKENIKFLNFLRTNHHVRNGNLSIEPTMEVYKGTPIFEKIKDRLKGNYVSGFKYRIPDWRAKLSKLLLEFLIKGIYPFVDRINRKKRYKRLRKEGILINRFN
ncbi:radical SAM protein [candidate division KSB1 bacterium]|nr:MAG: radical SAM protein [candidate division KSB1 bacterium]